VFFNGFISTKRSHRTCLAQTKIQNAKIIIDNIVPLQAFLYSEIGKECIVLTMMFFFSVNIFSGRRSDPIAKCHSTKKFGKWSLMVGTLFEAVFKILIIF